MIIEYKVKIEADTKQKAQEALMAMLDIKKAMSHTDLLLFAKKIKEKPHLLELAKKWL